MNKTESLGVGILAGVLIIFITWSIWTYWVFKNIMIVLPYFGYDLEPIQHEFYWLFVGIWFLWSIHTADRVYHYARRGDKA